MKSERGATYLELMVAVFLVAMASVYALATWNLSSRAPANKRATEMGVYVATQQLERWEAVGYDRIVDTLAGSPQLDYYDRYGAQAAGAVTQGYVAKSWVSPIVDRNTTFDAEDLLEVRVEVWNSDQTKLLETARTLLASWAF